MNVRRCRAVLALCWIAVTLAGCKKEEKEPEPVVTVEMAKVQKTSLKLEISTDAVLFPKDQAAITPKVVAPVRKFYVNRGSRVHKGQLLAVLENRDIAAAVTENKGGLEQAQASYDTTIRGTLPEDIKKAEYDQKAARESLAAQQVQYDSRLKLFKEGALPRKDLDQAAVALAQARAQSEVADQHLASMQAVGKEATAKSAAGQLTSARGKYEGAQAQLTYSEIRSPINGVVTERSVWPGETPPSGTPLLTVMDTISVTARAHIPQEQAALLKVGDLATITAPDSAPVTGKVTIVSPALDPGSTTVEVWVEAPNKNGALRPGSAVKLQMVAKTIDGALAIPAEALLKTPEGGSSVMLVGSDSKAHQTSVEIGIHSGDLVQITKGLQEGQTVVTTGAYGLPDNTQVRTGPEKAEKNDTSQKPSAEKDKD